MEKLLSYLNSLPPGEVAHVGKLDSLLADCWHLFKGSGARVHVGLKIAFHRKKTGNRIQSTIISVVEDAGRHK